MKYTQNYNLKKPEGTDSVNIDDLNYNADVLDEELATHVSAEASLTTLGHVKHAVLTATLDTTWSGSAAPYSQTITVNGITSTDTPIVDVVMSGTYTTDQSRLEQWGYVYRITTADNSITVYATDKPTVELPIQIKVVR